MAKITWGIQGKNVFMSGDIPAESVKSAIDEGREYLLGALNGNGVLTIYEDGRPIREDWRGIKTGFQWNVVEYDL